MDGEQEKQLAKLQKWEKGFRAVALAGLLIAILAGALKWISLLAACVAVGVVLGAFLIASGVLNLRMSALLPPPENPKRDPIVNQAMSVLFGLLILALCIFVLIQALK